VGYHDKSGSAHVPNRRPSVDGFLVVLAENSTSFLRLKARNLNHPDEPATTDSNHAPRSKEPRRRRDRSALQAARRSREPVYETASERPRIPCSISLSITPWAGNSSRLRRGNPARQGDPETGDVTVWLKIAYSSVRILLFACLAAHDPEFPDGLQHLSDFCCLRASPGLQRPPSGRGNCVNRRQFS
jgi:hypothetical protein